jgi:hypothetical protein
LSSGKIVAVFVGVLLGLALVAAVFVFVSQPPPPVAPCQPGQPCAPQASLPPVASATFPTPAQTSRPPTGNSPPAASGTAYTDASLGYGFEYNPDTFTLADSGDGFAVLTGNFFDTQIWIDAVTADTSPDQMMTKELDQIDRFLIARVADTDAYDALLGPSIGYIRGQGGVWSGTLLGRDGTPLAPGGVTIVSSTDGRITVAVVVIVGTPDARQGDETQEHSVRTAADDILKTFKWSTQ